MRNSRAIYIERLTEIILEIIFYLSRVPSHLDATLNKSYLRLATLREKISRREYYRFEIIKIIIKLVNTILLDILFVTYDYESLSYKLNILKFIKKLKPTSYY